MVKTNQADVVIVGAGIIGLSAAFRLQEAGRSVTLIDKTGIARGTSFGNAAAFAFSDVLPMAAKGMIGKVPGWLMDPLGPLSIPPAYFVKIMPWLVRFWRAGWRDKRDASIAAQVALMELARSEMAALTQAAGTAHMVRSEGSLELYESEAEFSDSLSGWAVREANGIGFEHVRGARLAELQTGLAARFVAGTFVPQWQTVSEPYEFASALGAAVLAKGATLLTETVSSVKPGDDGIIVALGNGETMLARQVVIACGAWSKNLVAGLGDSVPLDTERGYNTTLPADAFPLQRQLIFGGHGFVVTPLDNGIRIGGAVELGGLELPPNYARADAMLKKAASFMPGLKTDGGKQWMGFRPSLPDSLPVIGRSTASPDIVYAFGHGHLGLTQSAATARLIADLISDKAPAIDITPFAADRF
ncbi:FAD-binding oxidoreductase [Devosia neptuniae]|jgi:D-amino-acid dehydrogenase|uniref:NAD(P)/FAD-dependent oxidoreductase n=1 Tax=Devosia TaxID=46913 RepID=UPI0022AE6E77|nr:FAD-binding oxidoreductase [Devosia neptuniae]MCZ4346857.1 FAD-binding oxidoreductase [Devosia neptuniae]|tara:strand:- start:2467 stop:3717 length:1251 start_codon:yes stop_codon:yes gene_type:complete